MIDRDSRWLLIGIFLGFSVPEWTDIRSGRWASVVVDLVFYVILFPLLIRLGHRIDVRERLARIRRIRYRKEMS